MSQGITPGMRKALIREALDRYTEAGEEAGVNLRFAIGKLGALLKQRRGSSFFDNQVPKKQDPFTLSIESGGRTFLVYRLLDKYCEIYYALVEVIPGGRSKWRGASSRLEIKIPKPFLLEETI